MVHQSRRPVSMVRSYGRALTIDARNEADRDKPRLQEPGDFIFYTLSNRLDTITFIVDGIVPPGDQLPERILVSISLFSVEDRLWITSDE